MIIKKTGFTLVELVIVIAIVILLSVISVPIYRGYQRKATQTEGHVLLGKIQLAQNTYYKQNGHFQNIAWLDGCSDSSLTSYNPRLGVDARKNKEFKLFNSGKNLESKDTMKYGYSASVARKENDPEKLGLTMKYNITSGVTITQEV